MIQKEMNIKLVDKEDVRTRYISSNIRNIKLVDKEDVEKIDEETNHINYIQKLEMRIKFNNEGKIVIEEILE